MSHLALLKHETQAIKNPPATFQTVSLRGWVNSNWLCFLAALSSCRFVEATCPYCYNWHTDDGPALRS
jgi:hypothetical protein